jgi:hypothetical protein
VSQGSDPVARTVAEFIVWLARRRFERDYRYRCPSIAERFLRWQGRRRGQELPSDLNAYCRELAIEGVGEAEREDVRRTIGDLRKFLEVPV